MQMKHWMRLIPLVIFSLGVAAYPWWPKIILPFAKYQPYMQSGAVIAAASTLLLTAPLRENRALLLTIHLSVIAMVSVVLPTSPYMFDYGFFSLAIALGFLCVNSTADGQRLDNVWLLLAGLWMLFGLTVLFDTSADILSRSTINLPWVDYQLPWLTVIIWCIWLMTALKGQAQVSGWSIFAISLSVWIVPKVQVSQLPISSSFIAMMLCLPMAMRVLERRIWLDELTGLPARSRLDSDLRSTNTDVVIAFADIDYFKRFNDRFGHHNGDLALRQFALILKNIKNATAYRYGGEEFVIIFERQEVEAVEQALNRFMQDLKQCRFLPKEPYKGNKVKGVSLTASVGYASSVDYGSMIDTLQMADRALYYAKEHGRNRITSASALKKKATPARKSTVEPI